MSTEQQVTQRATSGQLDAEVIIIGAGVTGVLQLYQLREAGFDVQLVEAGTGVGGTWYWNRYPGARFDSESYSYGYFFSPELLEEWEWSEHFAGQEETERYLNHVVDKFALRELMRFDTRIAAAHWDDTSGTWTLRTTDGTELRARFVISATGVLSVPYYAAIPGRDCFQGEAYHTGEWPHEPVRFAGKRVAIIGTGASAVQLIPIIAAEVESLTVYQRTPNWCCPLNNGPISDEEQAEIKATYDDIYRACRSTFAGFVHAPNRRRTFEDSKEERWATYEQLWNARGFAKLLSNYRDLMTDKAANDEFSSFLADKIRSRVHDPAVAEKLIPTDHGAGMKRMPMETRYYEAYNRPNVQLIDINESPITTVTERGIETSDGERQFDVIVWATGFDGFTGALLKMDITGVGGQTLREAWAGGAVTFYGLQVPRFPNLLIAGGPHIAAGNFPRATEVQVDFITGLLQYLRQQGHQVIDVDEAAAAAWTDHVAEAAAIVLVSDTSWFRGANIPGKPQGHLPYAGSLVKFREQLEAMADEGYPAFRFGTPVGV